MKRRIRPLLALIYRLLAPVVARLERFYRGPRLLGAVAPYRFVEEDAVENLHRYLDLPAESIQKWAIVGAWHGNEVPALLTRYRSCRFVLIEPSREAFTVLKKRFGNNPRCICLDVAASDKAGEAELHKMALPGNDSLLPVSGSGAGTFQHPGQQELGTQRVITVRLDDMDELSGEISCLWIDVQGFERQVLLGAEEVVARARSVFIEVTTDKVSYEGGSRFTDIYDWLTPRGFRLANLGTDPVNGQGNALWVRNG